MKPRVNLIVAILTLSCVLRALEGLKSDDKRTNHKESVVKKVIKEVHNKVAPNSVAVLRGEDKTKVVKTRNTGLGLSKDYLHTPGNIKPLRARITQQLPLLPKLSKIIEILREFKYLN
ncbi:hypothetical protein K0M31_009211 [Melipona bicolor]|uniref:Uncharacterized protein n=1 Tax=Melipona bicolor TaxID=60889 RepID=A0AA40KJP8_9HYME|nr:hypothetical protein K0M31_009211 [Melipona bicolor]